MDRSSAGRKSTEDNVDDISRIVNQKRFVCKSTLGKRYGLTPAMIEELGEPDKYCENPHWKTGPHPACLYSVERVEAWIGANRDRVETAGASRAKRSAAGKAVQKQKRDERHRQAVNWVNTVGITVAPLPATLVRDARRKHLVLTEKGLRAHVRHRLTNYDSLRQQLRGHEFQRELDRLLRDRTDAVVQAALDEWRAARGP